MWFWPEPATRLRELRALLRPAGRIAITAQPRWKGATADVSRSEARAIQSAFDAAGFAQMRGEALELEPSVVCVIGVNPS
jgi:hypothetical protein